LSAVEIVPVRTRRQWHDFHHLPFKVYAGDPQWVPPLLLERKFHFQAKHNPYFQHATAEFFLATRDGEPVGRITAQIDQLHLDRYQDATGHFGFIEAVDDPEVFAALLEAAQGWLRAKGMKRVIGPVSFSLWDQPGLLVEGFDTPPYGACPALLPKTYRTGWLSEGRRPDRLSLRPGRRHRQVRKIARPRLAQS
jgi:hypothetical protein